MKIRLLSPKAKTARVIRQKSATVWSGPGSNQRVRTVFEGQTVKVFTIQTWVKVSKTENHWMNMSALTRQENFIVRAFQWARRQKKAPMTLLVSRKSGAAVWTAPGSTERITTLREGTAVRVYAIQRWAKVSPDKSEWMNMVTLQFPSRFDFLRLRRQKHHQSMVAADH